MENEQHVDKWPLPPCLSRCTASAAGHVLWIGTHSYSLVHLYAPALCPSAMISVSPEDRKGLC